MKSSLITMSILGSALIVGTLAPMSTASAAPKLTCSGKAATIVGNGGVVRGTGGDDVIVLTAASTVLAGAGDDLICGSSSVDAITGGPGADVIFGREGADVISGGGGADTIFGDLGADKLYGNAGNDRLYGSADAEVLKGGSGRDSAVKGGVVISISISGMDLQNLRMSGSTIAFAAANPSTPGVDVVSVNMRQPMMMNAIVLKDSYGVHLEADQPDALRPGTVLIPNSVLPGPASGLYPVIQINGDTTTFGTRVPSGAGVSFRNDGSVGATVGLTGEFSVNGGQDVQPLTAVNLQKGGAASAPAPTSGTLFITQKWSPGELVDHSKIAASGATVPLKAGNTISVMLNGGKLQVV